MPKELDRYGRTIGDVFIRGVWSNRELVAEGLAWHFTRYSETSDSPRGRDIGTEACDGIVGWKSQADGAVGLAGHVGAGTG